MTARRRFPVNFTGCGMDNLTAKVEKVHLDEDAKRQEAARKLSKAIDPFVRTIDCSGCKSWNRGPVASGAVAPSERTTLSQAMHCQWPFP
jgi:hypothetical protein